MRGPQRKTTKTGRDRVLTLDDTATDTAIERGQRGPNPYRP